MRLGRSVLVRAAVVDYRCTIHVGMVGRVTVVPG